MKRLPALLLLLSSSLPAGLAASCGPVETVAEDPKALERADNAFLMGDFARASFQYENYLNEHPETTRRADILLRIAKCRLGEKRWEDAVVRIDEVLGAGPSEELRVEAHFLRGVAHNALWNPIEALRDLEIVEAAPAGVRGRAVREDEFRYRIGVTRIRTGDWKRGKADLRRVDVNGPRGGDAVLRLSLDSFAVQIASSQDEASAKRLAGEAKGRVRENGGDHLVLVGSFRLFEEARHEAERLRARYQGAFVVP